MDIAYKYHPEHFVRLPELSEIIACENEMALMNLISSILVLPNNIKQIPIVPVFAQSKTDQADTNDTIIELIKNHDLSKDRPLLLLGTLPYIFRQGIQAQTLMPEHKIDIASRFSPYLETFDTPLKGALPLSLYLDELHWILVALMNRNK